MLWGNLGRPRTPVEEGSRLAAPRVQGLGFRALISRTLLMGLTNWLFTAVMILVAVPSLAIQDYLNYELACIPQNF